MKTSIKFMAVGTLLIIVSVGSAIIIGLTYIPWSFFVTNPREAILIADIPTFILGTILGVVGSELDKEGK